MCPDIRVSVTDIAVEQLLLSGLFDLSWVPENGGLKNGYEFDNGSLAGKVKLENDPSEPNGVRFKIDVAVPLGGHSVTLSGLLRPFSTCSLSFVEAAPPTDLNRSEPSSVRVDVFPFISDFRLELPSMNGLRIACPALGRVTIRWPVCEMAAELQTAVLRLLVKVAEKGPAQMESNPLDSWLPDALQAKAVGVRCTSPTAPNARVDYTSQGNFVVVSAYANESLPPNNLETCPTGYAAMFEWLAWKCPPLSKGTLVYPTREALRQVFLLVSYVCSHALHRSSQSHLPNAARAEGARAVVEIARDNISSKLPGGDGLESLFTAIAAVPVGDATPQAVIDLANQLDGKYFPDLDLAQLAYNYSVACILSGAHGDVQSEVERVKSELLDFLGGLGESLEHEAHAPNIVLRTPAEGEELVVPLTPVLPVVPDPASARVFADLVAERVGALCFVGSATQPTMYDLEPAAFDRFVYENIGVMCYHALAHDPPLPTDPPPKSHKSAMFDLHEWDLALSPFPTGRDWPRILMGLAAMCGWTEVATEVKEGLQALVGGLFRRVSLESERLLIGDDQGSLAFLCRAWPAMHTRMGLNPVEVESTGSGRRPVALSLEGSSVLREVLWNSGYLLSGKYSKLRERVAANLGELAKVSLSQVPTSGGFCLEYSMLPIWVLSILQACRQVSELTGNSPDIANVQFFPSIGAMAEAARADTLCSPGAFLEVEWDVGQEVATKLLSSDPVEVITAADAAFTLAGDFGRWPIPRSNTAWALLWRIKRRLTGKDYNNSSTAGFGVDASVFVESLCVFGNRTDTLDGDDKKGGFTLRVTVSAQADSEWAFVQADESEDVGYTDLSVTPSLGDGGAFPAGESSPAIVSKESDTLSIFLEQPIWPIWVNYTRSISQNTKIPKMPTDGLDILFKSIRLNGPFSFAWRYMSPLADGTPYNPPYWLDEIRTDWKSLVLGGQPGGGPGLPALLGTDEVPLAEESFWPVSHVEGSGACGDSGAGAYLWCYHLPPTSKSLALGVTSKGCRAVIVGLPLRIPNNHFGPNEENRDGILLGSSPEVVYAAIRSGLYNHNKSKEHTIMVAGKGATGEVAGMEAAAGETVCFFLDDFRGVGEGEAQAYLFLERGEGNWPEEVRWLHLRQPKEGQIVVRDGGSHVFGGAPTQQSGLSEVSRELFPLNVTHADSRIPQQEVSSGPLAEVSQGVEVVLVAGDPSLLWTWEVVNRRGRVVSLRGPMETGEALARHLVSRDWLPEDVFVSPSPVPGTLFLACPPGADLPSHTVTLFGIGKEPATGSCQVAALGVPLSGKRVVSQGSLFDYHRSLRARMELQMASYKQPQEVPDSDSPVLDGLGPDPWFGELGGAIPTDRLVGLVGKKPQTLDDPLGRLNIGVRVPGAKGK